MGLHIDIDLFHTYLYAFACMKLSVFIVVHQQQDDNATPSKLSVVSSSREVDQLHNNSADILPLNNQNSAPGH